MTSSKEIMKTAAKEFLSFVNKSPSPFHAVEESRQRLLAAGFKELREQDHWNIQPSDKFFVTRNQSCLLAFAVGGKYKPGNGFTLIGAHTDSPCLKVKPVSRRVKEGFIQVGVECYGGGTWHTWTDRDLKIAGRVLVQNGSSIEHRLVDIDRPILRVPNLAIHLNRDLGSKFEFNKEEHFTPVLATCIQEQLETGAKSTKEVPDGSGQDEKHHPVLIQLLSEELKVSKENILDFELCLADHVPGTLGGVYEEFIFAPRLDNLHSSFCALKGLLSSCEAGSLKNDANIRAVCLFDNEEVGSQSAQGAGSMILEHLLRRISANQDNMSAFEEAVPQSLMLSADMAHGVHPNYSAKHEEQHRPALHKGVVIKFNANQRYATTSITTAILRAVASRAEVPIQDFVVRNDSPCGSTIGPIMSAGLGMPSIDIGCAQLSMHSIREMCDVSSVKQSVDLFTTYFEIYPQVFASMKF